MLDIKRTDTLVVGSKSYNIKSIEPYTGFGTTASFARMATVTASTKRRPTVSSGERGALATAIASLKCTPLDPVQADVALDPGLKQPHVLLQTFCGDTTGFFKLVVQDKDLP